MFGANSKNTFINVEDNLVNFCQQEYLYGFCQNSKYSFGHSSSTNTPDMSRFVCHLTEEEFNELQLNNILEDISKKHNLGDIQLLRSYINVYNMSSYLSCHTDDHEEGSITFLYYANPSWEADWGGETVFYDSQKQEIIKSILPKPGRIAVFDSTIPHASRPSTINALQQKFTIAIKARKRK